MSLFNRKIAQENHRPLVGISTDDADPSGEPYEPQVNILCFWGDPLDDYIDSIYFLQVHKWKLVKFIILDWELINLPLIVT